MKLTVILLLSCGVVLGADVASYADSITKPHTFGDGQKAYASQINQNFDTLYDQANKVGKALTIDDNATDVIHVDNTGNVGIGTTSPGTTLEVVGQVKITGGTPGAGKVLTSDAAGLATWAIPTGGSSQWTAGTGNIYYNDGNVGIGTTSPGTKLEVVGQVKITGGTPGSGKVLTSDAAGLATWATPTGGSSQWTAGTGNIYYNDGNVGIGTTNPGALVDISGFGTVTSGTGKILQVTAGSGAHKGDALYINSNNDLKSIHQDMNDHGSLNSYYIYSEDNSAVDFFVRGDGQVYMNGNVGIGTTSPNSALQVNGYVQLDVIESVPPAADCDEETEAGRMKFNSTSDSFYICSGASGWVTK